jgi:GNAT superfamily N-acetyltransferase
MNNLDRMIKLADEVFAVKNDPSQIAVDEEVMERLRSIHPRSLNQKENEDGPVAWVLVFPTTRKLMQQFLQKDIGEKELLDRTPPGARYDALYLCSALVLPEFRRKGLARALVLDSVRAIMRDHPIDTLFVWSFTTEGNRLAGRIAAELSLPLLERLS